MQLIVTFKGHLGNDDVVSRVINESVTQIAVTCKADFSPYLQYIVPSLLAAADVEVSSSNHILSFSSRHPAFS